MKKQKKQTKKKQLTSLAYCVDCKSRAELATGWMTTITHGLVV